MKAAVKLKPAPKSTEVMEVPVPEPTADEVLIRVKISSICGTDVHIYDWDAWADRPDGRCTLPRDGGAEGDRGGPQEQVPDGPREEGRGKSRPPIERHAGGRGHGRDRGGGRGRGPGVLGERAGRPAGDQGHAARGGHPSPRALPEAPEPRHLRVRHERPVHVRDPRSPDVQDVDADGRAPEERERELEADPHAPVPA